MIVLPARRRAFAFSHPAHVVAFGFGAGLAPRRAGHVRHAGRLGCRAGCSPARIPRSLFRSSRRLFRRRGLGLRGYRRATSACTTTARWCGTRSSRSCWWLALRSARASPWQVAGFVAVPRLRHRQAAADPLDRAALAGRLRRDVRRPRRRRATRCSCSRSCSACSSDGRSSRERLGARLKARERDAGHGRIVHRRLGGAGRDLGGGIVGLVRARLRHLFERGEAGDARRARGDAAARTAR